MSFEHKRETFSLFKNQDIRNEKSPAYRGSGKTVCPNCGIETKVTLAGWINEYSNGKYIGGSIKEDTYGEEPSKKVEEPVEEANDDIPF